MKIKWEYGIGSSIDEAVEVLNDNIKKNYKHNFTSLSAFYENVISMSTLFVERDLPGQNVYKVIIYYKANTL